MSTKEGMIILFDDVKEDFTQELTLYMNLEG